MSDRLPIDPELQAGLDRIPVLPGTLFDFDDLAATRDRLARSLVLPAPAELPGADVLISEAAVPRAGDAITVRIHRPRKAAERARPLLYWIHGGGMVIGAARDDDAAIAAFVRATGCVAIAVDYRLAPEHPFPVPQEDVYAGLVWAVEQAGALGADPGTLVVAGESAGGGLAAACAILARERGGPAITLQMLLCPMLDHRGTTASSREVLDVGVWDRWMNERAWAAVLGGLDRAAVPGSASPALERTLTGLPSAYVDVGTIEVFRDEAIEYASRLLASGVQTELHVWPGVFHVADRFVPGARLSREVAAARIAALGRAFGRDVPRP